LPDFKLIDPESIDLLLVTHFHLDHAASLPYFTERTDFKGRVFMTHATKAVLHLMLRDYLRLMTMRGRNSEEEQEQLYSEEVRDEAKDSRLGGGQLDRGHLGANN